MARPVSQARPLPPGEPSTTRANTPAYARARTPSSYAPPLSLAQPMDSTVKPAKAASSTPATTALARNRHCAGTA